MTRAVGRQPIEEEFSSLNLSDNRLDIRLKRLAQMLGSEFELNIPQACESWKEIKGAYRFFANPRVHPDQIQSSHFLNTIDRLRDSKASYFLLIQDTTAFNYHRHWRTRNLGSIGNVSGRTHIRGIYGHTGIVCTPNGTPLGIVFQKLWLRKPFSTKKRLIRRSKYSRMNIKNKESFRWVEVIRVAELVQQQAHKPIIIVHDKEGDINEVILEALNLNIGFVIRARECVFRTIPAPHFGFKSAPCSGASRHLISDHSTGYLRHSGVAS